jgi:hypothetical protein
MIGRASIVAARSRLRVKGSCGPQADGRAGLPPTPEYPVYFGTYASCQQPTVELNEAAH